MVDRHFICQELKTAESSLHGGPGGGSDPSYLNYFDLNKWHVIMFDQRGGGKSKPFAELKDNNTASLIKDIEKLKTRLGINKWMRSWYDQNTW